MQAKVEQAAWPPCYVREFQRRQAIVQRLHNNADLIAGAKAMAAMDGRPNVTPEDVRRVAIPVLRHRVATNFQAQAEGMAPENLIEKLVAEVPEPNVPKYED